LDVGVEKFFKWVVFKSSNFQGCWLVLKFQEAENVGNFVLVCGTGFSATC
jgi:hypothetical protein